VSRLHSVLAKFFVPIIFSSCYASAGIRPSFYLESCSWNATDIVVLTPAGGLTQFKIVETIKGALKQGDALELQGLASSKGGSKKLLELVGDWHPFEINGFQDPPPAQRGDRLVVFLRRPGALPEYNPRPDLPVDTAGWQSPQVWGGLLTSTVWIQDGKLFAYLQTSNPGSTHLVVYQQSEEEVRSQVSAVLGLRAAMDRAAAISDPVERSRQLVGLMRSGNLPGAAFARASALRKLSAGGEVEADALLGLLSDESLLGWHQDIIQALAGKSVAELEFSNFLTEETRYWSKACASLRSGWWSNMSNPEVELSRNHYTRARSILEAIRIRKLSRTIPEIRRFAGVWSQCSAPGGRDEKDQIAKELNLLLASADR
jgi:hypothetical protein